MSLRHDAYVRGYEDHGDGVTMCPYPFFSGLADAWQTGWDAAAGHAAAAAAFEVEMDEVEADD